MKSALSVIASGFVAIALACLPADAATASRSIGVSATVLGSCAASASPMSVRAIPAGATVSASSTLSVNCTYSTPYNVDVGPSSDLAAGAATANRIPPRSYSLRSNKGTIVVWDGSGASKTVAEIGGGSVHAISILRLAPMGSGTEGGSSADAVVLTVTY